MILAVGLRFRPTLPFLIREIRGSTLRRRSLRRSRCSSPLFFHQGRAFAETFAEVSQFRAAGLAFAFDFNFVHPRRVNGKYALDAFSIADAADGKHFVQAVATSANYNAGKNLDTFFVAFNDLRVHAHTVANAKIRGGVFAKLFRFNFIK